MADLVVKDLADLVSDLDLLIGEFEGALDLQNEDKGLWGQLNANLSMGDFAANWRIHRDRMVKAMKTFRDEVKSADDGWAEEDRKQAESLHH